MSSVSPASSTVAYIRQKIRKLTTSPSESSLATPTLDQYLNNFYTNDFPYGIKVDQMRSVYKFYTQPYVDQYPLDVNYSQGIRGPMYIDGIQGSLFKDRQQFFNTWPKFPTKLQPASGDGVTTSFSFTIQGPILPNTVTLGCLSTTGSTITITDDGSGNLYYRFPNTRVYDPSVNANPQTPGMSNSNTLNPGVTNSILVGTVGYVTGVFAFDTALASVIPASGEYFNLFYYLYQTGRPYSLLFWNNTFTIRPVPRLVHEVEVEIYLTPVQFMESTNTPILNQWAKYLAYGAAMDILFDRQDLDGVENLKPMLDKQEALVLERQAVEEINTPNYTLFNSTVQNYGYGAGLGGWGGW